MSFEQGLIQLVASDPTVAGMSTCCGCSGTAVQLPSGVKFPAWTYMLVTDHPDLGLQYVAGYNNVIYQFDCYGNNYEESVNLAHAIYKALNGYSGPLPGDPSTTV